MYVPDKTARKNKVVQCNEEEIDAEIDEGCVEDLKKLGKRTASEPDLDLRFEKKHAKRTASAASALEESELAWPLILDPTPEGEKKKKEALMLRLGCGAWALALVRSCAGAVFAEFADASRGASPGSEA